MTTSLVPGPDRRFLAGPRSRLAELGEAAAIFREFIAGFRHLHFVGPCVTVFGSARFSADHSYYALARAVGLVLVQHGFTVMTGGGPGIMEAANRGAREGGGTSIGCNIALPVEQRPNPFLDVMVEFQHFFVRKVMLTKYSYGFIALPGGLGTMDEIFETLTLIQTAKLADFPLVMMGQAYWTRLIQVTPAVDRILSVGRLVRTACEGDDHDSMCSSRTVCADIRPWREDCARSQILARWILARLLRWGSTTESINMENIDQLFSVATGEIERILNSKTVVGQPIVVDGSTMIPLLSIGIGFGVGSGTGSDPKRGQGGGSGIGGGGGIRPVAVLIVDKDGARLETLKGGAASAFEKVADVISRSLNKRAEDKAGKALE